MNILMALSQREITGAEVYAATLTEQLMKRGHKVVIVSDTLTVKSDALFIPLAFNERSLADRFSHVRTLCRIIKEHDIQVVHAHSRASAWSCAIACKLCRIPLITTTHGRQPVHLSRKINKSFGVKSICVCENIRTQICNDLGYAQKNTILLRNPVDATAFNFTPKSTSEHEGDNALKSNNQDDKHEILVALVGRLSGPKGDVAYEVLSKLSEHKHIQVQIIGSKFIPERFNKFENLENVHFLGYRTDVPELMKKADVIIGAGRVGIEAMLTGRPLIAVGEAIYEGLVTKANIGAVLSSNFGDINSINETHLDFSTLKDDVEAAVKLTDDELADLKAIIKHEFDMERIVNTVEQLYSRTYVEYKRYEMPIIMYHRVVDSPDEVGVHGTYVTKELFKKHMQLLKDNGYRTVTFKELAEDHLLTKRFDKGNKFVVLTFDDGYEDNYRVMFPILKEFGAKAVIFLLSESKYNEWDVNNPHNPEKRFDLMSEEQVKEMAAYGVEFGAHTKTHPYLSSLPIEEAREQIVQCKQKLEQTYGQQFITFAYPYGDLNDEVKSEVRKAGFTFAVSTDSGEINVDSDLFQIRRIGIFPRNSMLTFRRKISGYYNFIKMRREEKAYGHHK
ncbi:MAG: polysaccharide deacetylase family protein [Anaerobiospirillum succiniciproducens]|uniref:polysaccharide deacetylase family protein n=1 Tax=Anaerobiospirillum succiniciproducens TaxID=13335 RepID=UPI0026DBF619|nr:polysaccharide deacetylase family protein [Anaerobiospirillum succiniciproducens]MDO4676467.1 polysaccharide deacetylase family protein [Anaerobiospirillum succiniciproducens]